MGEEEPALEYQTKGKNMGVNTTQFCKTEI